MKKGAGEFRHTIHGTRGVISSPNFPRHYPLNTTVVWLISVRPTNTIQVNFTNFNLEKNKKCIYDYVFIEEKLMEGGAITRKYCGHRLPPNFTSVSNKIRVVFMSDSLSNVELGFRANWKEVYGSSLHNFVKPTKSSCTPATVTVTKSCIRASAGVNALPINPSKCSCMKVTTKTVTVAVPTKSTVPKATKQDEASNQVEFSRCDPSNPHSLVDNDVKKKQAEEKDRSKNLVVSLGVVLIALFITNIFLLVLLCKRDRGHSAISFNSLKRYLSGRGREMQSTPDMFFSSYTRPTLRMIDGEIVVVPPPDGSSPDAEPMRLLLEPYDGNKENAPTIIIDDEDQLSALPFHIVPQIRDNTLNSETDETTLASTRTDPVSSDNDTEAV
eukprot:gene4760-5385_t